MSGGGQERGLRSGTLPASLAVGMGEAARIAKIEMAVSVHQSCTVMKKYAHRYYVDGQS